MKGKVISLGSYAAIEITMPDNYGGFKTTIEEVDQRIDQLRENIVALGISASGKVPVFSVSGIEYDNHVRDNEVAKLTKKFMRLVIAGEVVHGEVIDSEL